MKIEISICTGLMLNDHSNPYIESTTVLSDIKHLNSACIYLRLQVEGLLCRTSECKLHVHVLQGC